MSNDGFHRVHLRSEDGDNITVYLPLAEGGRLNPAGHRPWLLKARWNGNAYLGELELGPAELNRIVWEGDDTPDSLTDLGTVPVKPSSLVKVHESDDLGSDWYSFEVIDVRKV